MGILNQGEEGGGKQKFCHAMMAIIALGLDLEFQKPLCEWGKREVPVSPRRRNSFLKGQTETSISMGALEISWT